VIFRHVAAKPQINVADGMIDQVASRNTLQPVACAVLHGTLGVSHSDSSKSDRGDEVPSLAVGVGSSHGPGVELFEGDASFAGDFVL